MSVKEYVTVHVSCECYDPNLNILLVIRERDWELIVSGYNVTITCDSCGEEVPIRTRESGEYVEGEMEAFFLDKSITGVYENTVCKRYHDFDGRTEYWASFRQKLEAEFGTEVHS